MRSFERLIALIVAALFVSAACGARIFGKSPSEAVRAAYMAANAGQYSEASKYLSSDALRAAKGDLGALAGGMKGIWDTNTRNGSIAKIEILHEEVRGEGAEVSYRFTFKDNTKKEDCDPLIKENGDWKIASGRCAPRAQRPSIRPQASASTDSSPGSRTVDAMRNIAIGIASYLGTSGKYPRASNINELCAELTRAQTVAAPKGSVEVRHLKTCSNVDEWGTAFRYHHFLKGSPPSATASDHEGFRLVSAGADKRFAPSIDLAAPQGSSGLQVKGANRSTNEDIVLQEGMFLTWPPGQKPEIVQMFDD